MICKFRWVELTRLEVEFLQKEKTKKANQAKKKRKKEKRIWVNTRWSCRCLADKSTASPVPLQHVDWKGRGREQTMRHGAMVKATYKETVCVLPSLISAHYLCLSEDLWVRLLRKRWNTQRRNTYSYKCSDEKSL